jgi:hypothetical protein
MKDFPAPADGVSKRLKESYVSLDRTEAVIPFPLANPGIAQIPAATFRCLGHIFYEDPSAFAN